MLSALLGASAPSPTVLPSQLDSGRMFYVPKVRGHRLMLWMDTAGSGFVTSKTVAELGLVVTRKKARLPNEVVQPTVYTGLLPVISPSADDKILAGISAQLGATWFQDRIVRFDYPHGQIALLPGAPPTAGSRGRAVLKFPMNNGARINGEQYPSVEVAIEGEHTYRMSFDTAATVVLSQHTLALLHDGWGAKRATGFVPHALAGAWHLRHPVWRYIAAGGANDGVDLIEVPSLLVGTYRATHVWFSTRPGDDVFEGESVAGKLGPTAFAHAVVTLDYPSAVAYFD